MDRAILQAEIESDERDTISPAGSPESNQILTSNEEWSCEQTSNEPVDTSIINGKASKKGRKNINRRRASRNEAFYQSSQPNQAPLMYFNVKYYGICDSIASNSMNPVMVNVSRLIEKKKEEAKRDGVEPYIKGQIYFSEKGLAVIEKSKETPTISWFTHNLASMASIKHPTKSGRRIALMKVRGSDGILKWHLFKYISSGKTDNMSECFRYIVDCSLREIGRAVAKGNTNNNTRRTQVNTSTPTPYEAPPLYAPSQDSSVQRELTLDHLHLEARAEADDIAKGQNRLFNL